MNGLLERTFEIEARKSSVKTELLAGLSTFLTMSYILFVNPSILSSAGMDFHSVYVATCFAGAFGCLVMGLYANYPIALAPGMGLNAYFASTVVIGMGVSWQVALGAVFCSGVLFVLISVLPIREWVINSIPKSQKLAIAAGIGFFLMFIGLQNAGIVIDHPATLVGVGNLVQWPVLLVVLGFVVMAALDRFEVPGVIALTILVLATIGWIFGLADMPQGFLTMKPSMQATFLELDIVGALEIGILVIVFAFLLVDLFDTSGTLVALLQQAGLLEENSRIPNLRRALLADSTATVLGSLFGTSTTTSYVESAAGIRAGGRTGLTALTVAVLMLLMLFLEPLAGSIPSFAVAPAIFFVGCVMAKTVGLIDWEESTEALPAIVTVVAIPFTYSIATGIGMGFISYVLIKLISAKSSEIHPALVCVAAVFLIKFVLAA